MKDIPVQGTFEDCDPEYAAFVEKFKPKKTTDDCYTPEAVYNTVRDWAVRHYGLEGREIVRPFWPGGDYERFKYPDGCVVIDNPPFSILSRILGFYNQWKVDYFLFAPALTLFSAAGRDPRTGYVVVRSDITYENGAKVCTCFATSLGENLIETAPDLARALKAAQARTDAKALPRYEYPPDVATAAALLRIASVPFAVPRGEALFTRRLDAQDGIKDSGLFVGGFILSTRAAAERAAEKEIVCWGLSARERELQRRLAPPAARAKEVEKLKG